MNIEPNITEEIKIFDEPTLILASGRQRFLNFLIDLVAFRIVIFLLFSFVRIFVPYLGSNTNNKDFAMANFVVSFTFSILLYALFMGLQETIFKGQSLGKFITGTKAVDFEGKSISRTTAFLRGFSRAVPFCVFSALGSPCLPWQDRWTDTIVIDLKSSRIFNDTIV